MSYLHKDKFYYCVGEDITQSFPKKENQPPSKKTFLDNKSIHQSIDNFSEKSPEKKLDDFNYKDLGRDLYDWIKNEYKSKNKVSVNDPEVLFEYWKRQKKLYNEKKLKDKGLSNTLPDDLKKKAIFSFGSEDVNYTLKLHSNDAKQETNISNFFQDRSFHMKMMAQTMKNSNKKFSKATLNRLYPEGEKEKTNSRRDILFVNLLNYYIQKKINNDEIINHKKLYECFIEMSQFEKKRNKLEGFDNNDEVQILLEDYYDKECKKFCSDLEINYKHKNPTHIDYKRPNILFNFWSQNKENDKISPLFSNEDGVKQVLISYYYKKIDLLCELFFHRYGFSVANCKNKNGIIIKTKQLRLFEFWKLELIVIQPKDEFNKTMKSNKSNITISNAKSLNGLDFESDDNIIFLIDQYFQEKDFRDKIKLEQKEKQEKILLSKIQEDHHKKIKTKDQIEKFYNNLSNPKDRLKLGKALLQMRKMFPNDPVLLKMILHEFKENKIAKYPLEYDVYDEGEEEMIKGHKIENNINISDKEKEQEIYEHFAREIENYYDDKSKKLRENKQKINNDQAEINEIIRFMRKIAKQFISLRKKRFEEKIPTLNEYLSENYLELVKKHKKIMKKMFPHLKYGESKRLKQRSYPLSFKHYFFQIVKSFIKNKDIFESKASKKLPFWAPPSSNGRCTIHVSKDCPLGCKYQSMNHRVVELSHEYKEAKIKSFCKGKNKVWELPTYFEDRTNIMMSFDDAGNCTFTPALLSRMPEKYKSLMEQVHASWAKEKLSKPRTFKNWVIDMGTNFKKRFPMIYKFGVFKRAKILFVERGEIKKAYLELAQAFNINEVKNHFNPNNKPLPTTSIFHETNLDIDKSKIVYNDNFKDPKYLKFMLDVYELIIEIEKHESDINKFKKEVERMMKSEQLSLNHSHYKSKSGFLSEGQTEIEDLSYSTRRNIIKSHMCPLKGECPDDIRPRWPNNKNKSILPFGSKCPFAHHTYELRFKHEKKLRKKLLKNILVKVDKYIEKDAPLNPIWMPAARKFVECNGCGKCSNCEVRNKVNEKLKIYLTKAKLMKKEITKTRHFNQIQEMRKESDKNLNLKLGFLQRANILYSKERYAEAFTIITKAIEIVKNEMIVDENKQKNLEDDWKKKIDLNIDINITPEMVYKEQFEIKGKDDNEPEYTEAHIAQKLRLFAEKTGVIGYKQPNTNDFINYQIELTYYKIEKTFLDKEKDIKIMKNKIDRLEGGVENTFVEEKNTDENTNNESSFKKKTKIIKTKMCPELMEKKKCSKISDLREPCFYAHSAIELDLVEAEKKINNLQKTIKFTKEKMTSSEAPIAWRPTSKTEAIINIDLYDQKEQIRKLVKLNEKNKGKNEISKSPNKSLYDKDFDDVAKLPFERTKNHSNTFA